MKRMIFMFSKLISRHVLGQHLLNFHGVLWLEIQNKGKIREIHHFSHLIEKKLSSLIGIITVKFFINACTKE